jgi:hypothetical protein
VAQEILVYLASDPAAEALVQKFPELFPRGVLEAREWTGGARKIAVTLPKIGAPIELAVRAEPNAAKPKSRAKGKAKKVATATLKLAIALEEGPPIAVAWALASALADVGDGIVVDAEGEQHDAAEAKRASSRASREADGQDTIIDPRPK